MGKSIVLLSCFGRVGAALCVVNLILGANLSSLNLTHRYSIRHSISVRQSRLKQIRLHRHRLYLRVIGKQDRLCSLG